MGLEGAGERARIALASLITVIGCGEGAQEVTLGDPEAAADPVAEAEQGLSSCSADLKAESDGAARIAYVRAVSGRAAEPVSTCVRAIARLWAKTMCEQNKLYHTPNLIDRIHYACAKRPVWAAENVGVGAYRQAGTGKLFVAHDFADFQ